MENTDLIARTSYGENNGENTITTVVQNDFHRYTSTISETYGYRYALHTCISLALGLKVPLGRKTEKKKTDYKFGKYF